MDKGNVGVLLSTADTDAAADEDKEEVYSRLILMPEKKTF